MFKCNSLLCWCSLHYHWILVNNNFTICFAYLQNLNITHNNNAIWTFPISFNKTVSIICTGSDVSGADVSGYLIQSITTSNCKICFWAQSSFINTAKFKACGIIAIGY